MILTEKMWAQIEDAFDASRELFIRVTNKLGRVTRYIIRLSSRVTQLEKATIDRFNKTLDVLENHQSSIEIHAREIRGLKNALRSIGANPSGKLPEGLYNPKNVQTAMNGLSRWAIAAKSSPVRNPHANCPDDCSSDDGTCLVSRQPNHRGPLSSSEISTEKSYREPGCQSGPDCAFCKYAKDQRKNKLGTTYGALAR